METNTIETAGMDTKLILRYPIPALVVILIMTACVGYGLKGLKVASDPLASMVPIGHPYISTLNAIKAMTPESRLLVCILKVKKGDIYTSETLKKIDSITRGLLAVEGIMPGGVTALTRGMMHYYNSVQGLNIESVMGTQWPETPEGFEALKRRVATNPMGLGRYVAYDNTAVMITAKLADINQISQQAYDQLPQASRPPFDKFRQQQKAQFNAKLVKALDDLKISQDDAGHTLYVMGQEVLTHQMTQMGAAHIGTAAGVMCGILIFLLRFYFRSIIGVVLPFITMGVSVVWSLGLYGWTGIELNPLMILFPLILALLTLALTTLFMGEYVKALRVSFDKSHAIRTAFFRLPIRRTILIAGLVMAGMGIAPVPVMRALAAMSLFWMIGAYVTVVLLSPIVLSLLPLSVGTGATHHLIPGYFGNVNRARQYVGLVMGLVLLIGGFLSYTRIEVGDNVPGTSYIRDSHPWNQCFNLLSEKFMGPQQLLVYVKADKPGGLVEPQAMNAISDFSRYLVNECEARDSIAFDMMIRMCRWTLMDGNPKWLTLPLTREELEGLAGTVFEQGGVDDFIDRSFTEGTISPFFPSHDTKSIDAYAEKMQAYIDAHPTKGISFKLGGGLLGMTKPQNDGAHLAYPRIMLMGMAIVLVLGMVLFSPNKGIAITLSVGCAQGAVWLIMSALGVLVSLSVVGVAAAAIAIGFILGVALFDTATADSAVSTGVLVFAASVPFFMIGMKFQAAMLIIFSAFVAAEIMMGMLVIPVFRGGRKV
ncbi:MAG: MMPL family transporter [Proteobacteria bacterium]|nr:MMPL family transporter [Pseudomonadota bacterium]